MLRTVQPKTYAVYIYYRGQDVAVKKYISTNNVNLASNYFRRNTGNSMVIVSVDLDQYIYLNVCFMDSIMADTEKSTAEKCLKIYPFEIPLKMVSSDQLEFKIVEKVYEKYFTILRFKIVEEVFQINFTFLNS